MPITTSTRIATTSSSSSCCGSNINSRGSQLAICIFLHYSASMRKSLYTCIAWGDDGDCRVIILSKTTTIIISLLLLQHNKIDPPS